MTITDIHTVGVPVTDQDRALAFYVDTLGLEKRMDNPFGDGRRWIEVAPSGAATTIALIVASEGVPACEYRYRRLDRSPDAHGPAGVADPRYLYSVETGIRLVTTDADTTNADLRAHGVDADEVLRWPGVPPMFALRDPDGNGLEIIERL